MRKGLRFREKKPRNCVNLRVFGVYAAATRERARFPRKKPHEIVVSGSKYQKLREGDAFRCCVRRNARGVAFSGKKATKLRKFARFSVSTLQRRASVRVFHVKNRTKSLRKNGSVNKTLIFLDYDP